MSEHIDQPRAPRNRDNLSLWKAEVRAAVKAIGLRKSETDVCIVICNHYWAFNKDKNSARGMGHKVVPVHPGLQTIADRAGISRRSARRASQILQKLGILKVVGCAKGGRRTAQHWLINFQEIYASKGVESSDLKALRPTRKGGHKGGQKADTVSPCLKEIDTAKENTHENVVWLSTYRRPEKERVL